MNGTIDREKKITEIRIALEKIDRGDLFEIAMTHEKSGEWLRFLLDELDRLRAEQDSHGPEGRNYTNKQYVDLLEERDKLIEGLRYFMKEFGKVPVSPATAGAGHAYKKMIAILKEIGVTV